MKEIATYIAKCYKIEVNMFLRTNFLQNSTPELGCEIYVFMKLFFQNLKTFFPSFKFKFNFGAVLRGWPK